MFVLTSAIGVIAAVSLVWLAYKVIALLLSVEFCERLSYFTIGGTMFQYLRGASLARVKEYNKNA